MYVPAVLQIVPAMTFRPMSPALAQQIENAYRDLAAEAVTGPARAVVPIDAAAAPAEAALDLRA